MCDLRRGKVTHHGLFPFHRESCLMRVRLRRDPEPDFTPYAGLAQRRLHLICNEAFTGGSSPSPSSTRTGRVAERPIAPVLKTDERTKTPRGFESHLFRHTPPQPISALYRLAYYIERRKWPYKTAFTFPRKSTRPHHQALIETVFSPLTRMKKHGSVWGKILKGGQGEGVGG